MDDKEKGKEGQLICHFQGKLVERSSDSTSLQTEKPPAKSVKFPKFSMALRTERDLQSLKQHLRKYKQAA